MEINSQNGEHIKKWRLSNSLVTSLVSGVAKLVTKLISEKWMRFLKQIKI